MKSIAILEDNYDLRSSVEEYFRLSDNYKVTFSSDSYNELVGKRLEIIPHYLLLDIHLCDMDVSEKIRDIKELLPTTSIIIVTGDKDKSILYHSLQKGASAFIYKPFKMSELEQIFSHINTYGSYLAPDVVTRVLNLVNNNQEPTALKGPKPIMNEVETEVMKLLVDGKTLPETSAILDIPSHKIFRHTKWVYKKNDVKNLQEFKEKFKL